MLSLKLSLLLLYLRVFALDKITKYLIYFGMAICVVAYSALMFLNIFSNVKTVIVANKFLGAINFASDIYIFCVPVAATAKLRLSRTNRTGVVLLFTVGLMYVAILGIKTNGSTNLFLVLVR